MTAFLHLFLYIPLVGFIVSMLLPAKNENLISRTAFITVGLHFLALLTFLGVWFFGGHERLNLRDIVLYSAEDYEFYLDFSFDRITAVYLFVGALLTLMVTIYSRAYMHREAGYKRFFSTILFFYVGYNLTILSGNLETLFIGWEMLGISSFLLIAFYRNRYLPVKNAVKVFSIYRIGDIGIILAMWMSHHLWHENITFAKLRDYELVSSHLQGHSWIGVVISLALVMTAAAKSAQLPFSSWLPRAMEGPTPSSAIFYGSLSVHLGVFLLLRSFPFWEHQFVVRVIIVLLGLSTSIVASLIARVQSSVKSQIAYSSIAQIGLIFIEIALGFENLALFHFAGNAFLRTYQLLVSPSVVSYMIKEQFYNFVPKVQTLKDTLPQKLEYSLYMLSLKEWNLDTFMYRRLWNPLKMIGKKLDFMTVNRVVIFFLVVYGIGLYSLYHRELLSEDVRFHLPLVFSFIAVVMVLKSFSERKNVKLSWLLIVMNHFWVALAVSFNETFRFEQVYLYLSGIVVGGIIGWFALRRLRRIEQSIDLDQFHGHSYHHPKIAFVFLITCLAMTGFPITPTFIGEDLIFSHIHSNQYMLAFFISLSFVVDGLSIIRIYARVFLGPHSKSPTEMAYRSS